MIQKNINNLNPKIDLFERFKQDPLALNKIKQNQSFFKENFYIRNTSILDIGNILTTNYINELYKDFSTNIKTNNVFFSDIKKTFNTLKIDTLSELKNINQSILDNQTNFEEIINKNDNSNIIINDFNRLTDSNYFSENMFIDYDPLTKSNINRKYRCSIEENNLSLSIKEIKNKIIKEYILDYSSSNIGHNINSITDINDLINNKPFIFSFSFAHTNTLTNKFKSINDFEIGIWCNLFGNQTVNSIKVNTHSNLLINTISILDHNENELSIDYNAYYNNNNITILFNNKITSAIKITFKAISDDFIVEDNIIKNVYMFSISSILIEEKILNNFGYFVSYPIKLDTLNGAKISYLKDLKENYTIDSHLLISGIDNKTFIEKEIFVPIRENYFKLEERSLYVVNNFSELEFFPNEIYIYENDKMLTPGIDFKFISNNSDTESNDLPIPVNKNSKLTIKFLKFNSQSNYYYNSIIATNTESEINYSNSVVNLNKLNMTNLKINLLFFIRQKNNNINNIPIINKYILELF